MDKMFVSSVNKTTFTSCNLEDSQLPLEFKTESRMWQRHITIRGGGPITIKTYSVRGDTAYTLLMGEQLGWGHRTTLKEHLLDIQK